MQRKATIIRKAASAFKKTSEKGSDESLAAGESGSKDASASEVISSLSDGNETSKKVGFSPTTPTRGDSSPRSPPSAKRTGGSAGSMVDEASEDSLPPIPAESQSFPEGYDGREADSGM